MIRIENLKIEQGNFLLSGIDLSIESGQYAVLMGATGCGKTTLLEAMCGLRPISGGKIWLDDCEVSSWPVAARHIGYVPQDVALFPAMRVEQQIGFGLAVRKIERAERSRRVLHLAELLDIRALLARYPRDLSGGEKQRVAIARALSFRPRLLCLDEPLSALDQPNRDRLAQLLKSVHQQEQATVLHVTHSAAEARELGSVHFYLAGGGIRHSKTHLSVDRK